MTDTHSEEEFYSRYDWCLSPPLSTEDLLRRLEEEIEVYPALTGWQREESKANLYLFTCAVACTTDDYLALHPPVISALSKRFSCGPILSAPIRKVTDASHALMKIRNRTTAAWRQQWKECIEHACALLMCDAASEADHTQRLRTRIRTCRHTQFPPRLLKRRMRLPEAFRSQDMSHQDVLTLIQRFCASFNICDRPTIVMGLRTAGAYFAPLMAEFLKKQGWTHVTWFSIRPKSGLTPSERRNLGNAAARRGRFLLVDDYPATGNTLRIALELMDASGILREDVVILAPTHAAEPNWVQLVGIDQRTPVITIQSSDLYKNACLQPNNVAALCRNYYARNGVQSVRIVHSDSIDQINFQLAQHSTAGHHVREKRVFTLELSGSDGRKQIKKILFKSVGWGWLGYHAYIAGTRLEGLVPHVVGLRNGLLAMDWIDVSPETSSFDSEHHVVTTVASYVAARARRLRLRSGCGLETRTYRWTGSDELLVILRSVYGRFINRLKIPALRNQLHRYHTATPTLIDGRMKPEDWIRAEGCIYKTDFEHHNFGGGELDIVDPAYDLAAAIFEFRLNESAEQKLLTQYQQESGDTSIFDRILIHKILYGSLVMRYALANVVAGREPEKNHVVYHAARDFLVYCTADFSAGVIRARKPKQWTTSLFFTELDSIFDRDQLGFPHATHNALLSLAHLQSNKVSVVVNTGRSVQDVRHYCRAYGFAGGVAEYGAVFVDAVHNQEIPLVDEAGRRELAETREVVKTVPGVFLDPSYEYAVRVCRYGRKGPTGVDAAELKPLLARYGCSRLRLICRESDTFIVRKSTSESAALEFVRGRVARVDSITAIGNSVHDVAMLRAADFAYAPANCSREVRDLAKQGKCRVLRRSFQSGLLAAVRDRFEVTPGRSDRPQRDPLMQSMLRVADRGILLNLLGVMNWWSL